MLEVCLLGCGGMAPLPGRRLASMLLRRNGKMILVDCGEGTQVAIKEAGWGFRSIEAVCITHYHADHVAGLPGFLLTLGNSGRTEPLTIFGPPPLAYILSALTVIAPELPYELYVSELSSDKISFTTFGEYEIKALPMEHAIPCLAYSFQIKRTGKFQKEQAEAMGIPLSHWKTLQRGDSIELNGKRITPEMVLGPERKGLKLSYCTDTRPTDALVDFSYGSDLLVCEGMYGDDAFLEKAKERKHMTFSEAANIALRSNSKELWLTHFSPSLKNPADYAAYARIIFQHTIIGRDLLFGELNFE